MSNFAYQPAPSFSQQNTMMSVGGNGVLSMPPSMSTMTVIPPSLGAATNMVPGVKHPYELFVGDLSFFCEEQHLLELFSQFGTVENCRIVRNDSKNRSLMFGFVCMSTLEEAIKASDTLNNFMYMGRAMKVELSEKRQTMSSSQSAQAHQSAFVMNGFQIHLSFSSNFHPDHVVRPTEIFLRDFFSQFGSIVEVVVREYTIYQGTNKQEGYGFLTFEEEEPAVKAAHHCKSVIVDGVLISSKLSYRNRPTGRVYDLGGGAVYVSQGPTSQITSPGMVTPLSTNHIANNPQQQSFQHHQQQQHHLHHQQPRAPFNQQGRGAMHMQHGGGRGGGMIQNNSGALYGGNHNALPQSTIGLGAVSGRGNVSMMRMQSNGYNPNDVTMNGTPRGVGGYGVESLAMQHQHMMVGGRGQLGLAAAGRGNGGAYNANVYNANMPRAQPQQFQQQLQQQHSQYRANVGGMSHLPSPPQLQFQQQQQPRQQQMLQQSSYNAAYQNQHPQQLPRGGVVPMNATRPLYNDTMYDGQGQSSHLSQGFSSIGGYPGRGELPLRTSPVPLAHLSSSSSSDSGMVMSMGMSSNNSLGYDDLRTSVHHSMTLQQQPPQGGLHFTNGATTLDYLQNSLYEERDRHTHSLLSHNNAVMNGAGNIDVVRDHHHAFPRSEILHGEMLFDHMPQQSHSVAYSSTQPLQDAFGSSTSQRPVPLQRGESLEQERRLDMLIDGDDDHGLVQGDEQSSHYSNTLNGDDETFAVSINSAPENTKTDSIAN